jgi:2-polyprenyl-6-methoxyphenol hydroxylase-like FAD-dependent oxidoreductase
MIPDNYKFVVVGGGTAGWLSALFLKKNIPKAHITVIESSDIGILGAGEGTVWNFIEFLQSIDISPADIVYHAQGTFKNGIKFTDFPIQVKLPLNIPRCHTLTFLYHI